MLKSFWPFGIEGFSDSFKAASTIMSVLILYASGKTETPEDETIEGAEREEARKRLDDAVSVLAARRREMLTNLVNALPQLNLPLGEGRPKGRKKSAKQKQESSAEFEVRLEAALQKLYDKTGKLPLKKRVAEELGIGGLGTKSSAFYNKLKRERIDYDAVAARVKLKTTRKN